MSDTKWKDALWNLLGTPPLPRLGARIALSAGLIGLAAPSSQGDVARVPMSPALATEATVRRFKGRYVLRRVANALTVRLVGHASHSSHASHASHSSHFSSSSSPAPAPIPTTPAPATPAPEPPKPSPPRTVIAPRESVLKEEFARSERLPERWRVGVIATPPESFDPNVTTEQGRGLLSITPVAHKAGTHFNGYVSIQPFDLNTVSIVVELRRAAAGASTIFAAAIDAANWRGFRIEGGQLAIESHTNGRAAVKKIPYSPSRHRFLRLRTSTVAPVVAWETSADGTNWNPEYVETMSINLTALRIALSAGTTKSSITGPAAFDAVIVEHKP